MLAIIVSLIPAVLGLIIGIGFGRADGQGMAVHGRTLGVAFGLIVLALIVARYA